MEIDKVSVFSHIVWTMCTLSNERVQEKEKIKRLDSILTEEEIIYTNFKIRQPLLSIFGMQRHESGMIIVIICRDFICFDNLYVSWSLLPFTHLHSFIWISHETFIF